MTPNTRACSGRVGTGKDVDTDSRGGGGASIREGGRAQGLSTVGSYTQAVEWRSKLVTGSSRRWPETAAPG